MTGRAALLAAASLALLAAHARWVGPPPRAEVEIGPARRLAGPFAGLLAELEWARYQRALVRGDAPAALARAESALALDPADAHGYETLVLELALGFGSAEREPDPARRRAWLEAALAVARRGEARARAPERVAFAAGTALLVKAESDPELGRPGGPRALYREAAEAFGRAAALGHPDAGVAAAYARGRAEG